MRALALSGGGSKIHYHAGAIRHLLGTLRIPYDIVAGVSAGAIAAAHLAQYAVGFEDDAAQDLEELLSRITLNEVRRSWRPFGLLQGLWKPSFYSSAPLRALLRRELSQEAIRGSGKVLRIGAVCAETGQFKLFTQESADVIGAVIGSSAFPGILEPMRMLGQLWIDGGVRVATPISAAIEAGADEIDVVMTSPEKSRLGSIGHSPSALEIIERSIEYMAEEIIEKDLKLALYTNALVSANRMPIKRVVSFNVIRPALALCDTFDFSPESAAIMRVQGQQDAQRVMGAAAVQ